MKAGPGPRSQIAAPSREVAELRSRLAEAEGTLSAIARGEVDAVVVAGKQGERVFTLEGAEHAYRVLIESMNEGALTLTADAVILYANQGFARTIQWPLERVIGSSLHRFLVPEDRTRLRPFLRRADPGGAKVQARLKAGDGSRVPVQISIRPMAKNGFNRATLGLVVTDMTEARRAEELLRALTHRMLQAQEAERGRVALELHDNITQLMCAMIFRSQVLAEKLTGPDRPLRAEAKHLGKLLGQAAHEVERISRNLRPSVLDQMGLVAVLRDTGRQFAARTGLIVRLAAAPLPARLGADIELALYRILQEALKNVEKHARARGVRLGLRRKGGFIQLEIDDDGIGFDPDRPPGGKKGPGGLGLVGMRERAAYVGGTLRIESSRPAGTAIKVCVPLAGHNPP